MHETIDITSKKKKEKEMYAYSTCHVICMHTYMYLKCKIMFIFFGALSGFKADFGPLLGTSNSPARDASRNMKMFEFDLLYRLKRCEVRPRIF